MSTKTWVRILLIVAAVALVAGYCLRPKPPAVTVTPAGVAAVVHAPTLKGADVTPFLSSPAAKLLVEVARKNKVAVVAASQTQATLVVPPAAVPTPVTIEAVAVAGTDAQANPTLSVNLFEVKPGGERVALPDVKTTLVIAEPAAPRWHLGAAVQAGVGAATPDNLRGLTPIGVAGVAWLRYGRGHAEDSKVAVLTPVWVFGSGISEPGLLPFSANLGIIPHMPLKDTWVSPVLTRHRVGVVLTATF
jgi:hypothetical protein